MVCRTPGSSEITPLRFINDNLDLRDLNASYPTPQLRLVSCEAEVEFPADQDLFVSPTYDAWQYLPRVVREQKVAAVRQRRTLARRNQAKRMEKMIFHAATSVAFAAALFVGGHLIASNYSAPQHFVKVVVAPGDTLWTVASRYTASGNATVNTVSAIRLANPSLNSKNALQVGEPIFVPALRS